MFLGRDILPSPLPTDMGVFHIAGQEISTDDKQVVLYSNSFKSYLPLWAKLLKYAAIVQRTRYSY